MQKKWDMNLIKYTIDGCFIDPDERFAFIHIYKNASISLRNALNMRGRYFKYQEVKDKNLTTITILRNPIDRFISMYLYMLRLEDNGFPNQHPIDITMESVFYKGRENVIDSFHTFLNLIYKDNFYDAVTYPQLSFIKDRNINIYQIDEIFIQERIKIEFEEFKEKYNLDTELVFPSDNNSNYGKKLKIKEHIDSNFEVKLKIMNIYAKDIQMYNEIVSDRDKNLII